MSAISFTQDAIIEAASFTKPMMLDLVEEEEVVTDVGQSSASDTEDSSGVSSDEGRMRIVSPKRCRFGKSAFATMPATPSAAAANLCASPPGLSRAAMRQARDQVACKPESSEATGAECGAEEVAPVSKHPCRLGETPFGTVPTTPVEAAKLKALGMVFRSPPGLSRTDMRRERDAVKAPVVAWGSSQAVAPAASAGVSSKRLEARDLVAKMKQEAALLKDLTIEQKLSKAAEKEEVSATSSESEAESSVCGADSAESDDATDARQPCRFGATPLGTVPSTPAGGEASFASPPGLSRKALRQARDMVKVGETPAVSWGTSTAPVLTINAVGKPMTPPAARAARVRAARDAVGVGSGSFGYTSLQVPQAPR